MKRQLLKKKIKVKKYVADTHCHGTGAKDGNSFSTCSTCHGTGQITRVQNTILGAMQTTSTCPTCEGEGKIINEKCSHCNGEGVQLSEEVITLNIPAGVADGMQLSLSGKGNAARRGGVNGDLIILIEEIEHPELVRDGNDLLYNTFIGFPEAVLGDSVEIPTLEGKVKVKIEPGTHPGKILRLKGKGIPDINGYGKGDLLVKVNVWIPKNLSKEDKKTMEDLKERSFLKPSNVENKKGFFRCQRCIPHPQVSFPARAPLFFSRTLKTRFFPFSGSPPPASGPLWWPSGSPCAEAVLWPRR